MKLDKHQVDRALLRTRGIIHARQHKIRAMARRLERAGTLFRLPKIGKDSPRALT